MSNFGDIPNPYLPPQGNEYSSYSQGQSIDGEVRNVVPEFGDIFNYAIKVWKENLQLVVLAALIVIGISFGIGFFNQVVQIILQGGFDAKPNAASTLFSVGAGLVANVVQIFLTIGQIQFSLNLLRGKPAELAMIFQGGERFLPTLGFSLLFGLAMMLGFVLFIIPGFIILFLFWPGYYLVIDRRTSVFESFGLARMITKGNVLNTLLLVLTSAGITMAGFLAFCIGIIFAQPLVVLLGGTAYLMMSGQLDPKSAQGMRP